MNSERCFEMSIPKKTLEDLLASHLYSISFADDNENVQIEFMSLKGDSVPINILLKKEREMTVYRYNGKS